MKQIICNRCNAVRKPGVDLWYDFTITTSEDLMVEQVDLCQLCSTDLYRFLGRENGYTGPKVETEK